MKKEMNKHIKGILVVGIITMLIGVTIAPAVSSNTSALQNKASVNNDIQENDGSILTTTGSGDFYAVIAATGLSAGLPVGQVRLRALYRALWKSANWNPDNIIVLMESQATLDNIRSALDTMANKVGRDDVFLFSWQGHGSEVPESQTQDDGAWSRRDELDLKDEVICPVDCGREGLDQHLVNYITDDELGYRFSKIKAKGMYCIFESCLSGGLIGLSARDTDGNSFIDDDEADGFSSDLREELHEDFAPPSGVEDINGWKRVAVVSSLPDTLGRICWLTGFPMHMAIASALRGGGIIGKTLNFGGRPDGVGLHPKNGIISAEESFDWAKPLCFAQNSMLWMGLWTYIFLAEYYTFTDEGDRDPWNAALEATKWLITEFVYVQLYTFLISGGHFMLNRPHMVDRYKFFFGELTIIELGSSATTGTVEIPPLPTEIWDELSWGKLSEDARDTIRLYGGSKESFEQCSWDDFDQDDYWPELVADAVTTKKGKTVTFKGAAYNAPSPYTFEWDFDGDGIVDDTTQTTDVTQISTYTYEEKGKYTATLKVTDGAGREKEVNIDVEAGSKSKSVNPVLFDIFERFPRLYQFFYLFFCL